MRRVCRSSRKVGVKSAQSYLRLGRSHERKAFGELSPQGEDLNVEIVILEIVIVEVDDLVCGS